MFDARAGREPELSIGMAARVQWLLDDGYAVLLPDSFNPRGRREVCTIRNRDRTISVATRRLDALGALAYLASLPGIDSPRIALVGWSHGGSTTLAAINLRDPRVQAFRAAPGAPPFFRAAVAFYPGCTTARNAGRRWQPGAPTRIHIGELDDWTPAQGLRGTGRGDARAERRRCGHRLSRRAARVRRAGEPGDPSHRRTERRPPGPRRASGWPTGRTRRGQ
jgi:hypothetical protein